jgi:phosphoserine phosphatase
MSQAGLVSDAPPPYGTVVFDCDSTLSAIEGIEELARDHREEVARLTNRAMDGELPLEEVYGARLELIRPSLEDLERVAAQYMERALPNAAALIAALSDCGKRVVVVSGGLLPAVLPFAEALGVAAEDVRAVDIRFDSSGAYAGFEVDSPLARTGGKPPILASLAASPGAGALAFIGDGATDLEAAGEAARFIAFGGVVRRENVFSRARVACEHADLAALVPLLFSADELAELDRDPTHAALLAAATPYLS